MKLRTKVAIVMILLLAGAVVAQTIRLRRAVAREWDAHVAKQQADLAAEGFRREAEASQAELAEKVPALEAELRKAQDAGARIASASHFEGHGREVEVPCTVIMGSPAEQTGRAPAPSSSPGTQPGTPPAIAVTPHVRIDDAVLIDDGGGIYVQRDVHARLSVGESWASGWEPVEPEVVTSAVDPELSKAWAAWRAPVKRLPWLVELHALLGGPDPEARLGLSWYPAGWRTGFVVQYGKQRRSAEGFDPYLESYYSRTETATSYAAGATWRFGPR